MISEASTISLRGIKLIGLHWSTAGMRKTLSFGRENHRGLCRSRSSSGERFGADAGETKSASLMSCGSFRLRSIHYRSRHWMIILSPELFPINVMVVVQLSAVTAVLRVYVWSGFFFFYASPTLLDAEGQALQ